LDLSFTQLREYGIFYYDPRSPGMEIFVKPHEVMTDVLTRYEELVRFSEVANTALVGKNPKEAPPKRDPVTFEFFFKLRVWLSFCCYCFLRK